jgi:DsbC/DsbD-like thiol-disulfide interchange protein
MKEESAMTRASFGFAACLVTCCAWFAVRADDKKEEKQSGPVKWSAMFEPKSVKPGGEATLKVKAEMGPGWHIYAVDKPTGYSKKTTLKLAVADKLTPDKAWKIPAPVRDEKAEDETYYYEGEVVFSQKVKANASAEGAFEAVVTTEFMACNEDMCLPPKKVVVKAALKVAK